MLQSYRIYRFTFLTLGTKVRYVPDACGAIITLNIIFSISAETNITHNAMNTRVTFYRNLFIHAFFKLQDKVI